MNPVNIIGRQHRKPQLIPTCSGPDLLSWQQHKELADLEPYQGLHRPVDPRSTDIELTDSFSR
eukprot:2765522-Heterocapsa_arctica.AAC.1